MFELLALPLVALAATGWSLARAMRGDRPVAVGAAVTAWVAGAAWAASSVPSRRGWRAALTPRPALALLPRVSLDSAPHPDPLPAAPAAQGEGDCAVHCGTGATVPVPVMLLISWGVPT
jgi:hypothetical protein